jgi:Domain of unknown function (DUF4832)
MDDETMYKLFINFLLIVVLVTACSDSGTGSNNKDEITLEEIDDVLPNPFKGFAPWIGNSNPVYQTKLQQATFGWADLETQKGQYNWSRLERNWGNITQTGKRVGFRVAAEIPGSGKNDTPQWLIDQGVKMRPYSIDGEQGLAPDWDDSLFLAAHHDFIMALGARYDDDPRVAWIDIGSYGFWGEWHVWLNDSLAANQASKKSILDDYFEAFPTKHKVIAFDDNFATEYVTDHFGGIRNDCLGTVESNDWYLESLNSISSALNEQVWKTAIITGEFCGSSYGAIEGTTDRFDINYAFIQQTHWSYIGPAGGAIQPQNEEHQANLDKLFKKLGYRFVLRNVDHEKSVAKGSTLTVTISVENKGVAPFYYDWPLVLYLLSSDQQVVVQQTLNIDIKTWLPGTSNNADSFEIPATVAAGKYNMYLAILDPDTQQPGVMFANTGRDEQGRYLVSILSVK